AAGRNPVGQSPDGGGQVVVAATRAVGIGNRVVDPRSRQEAVVARRAGERHRAGGLIDDDERYVVARLVIEAECVVPGLAAELVQVAVDRGLLGGDLRLGRAGHL